MPKHIELTKGERDILELIKDGGHIRHDGRAAWIGTNQAGFQDVLARQFERLQSAGFIEWDGDDGKKYPVNFWKISEKGRAAL
jgi:hypothetical protein